MRYALITNQDLFRMTGQGSTSNGEIPPLELCGLGILEGNAAPPKLLKKFKLTSEPPHQVNRDPFQAWLSLRFTGVRVEESLPTRPRARRVLRVLAGWAWDWLGKRPCTWIFGYFVW